MDFQLTEEQEAFRQDVRDFLKKELPEGWTGGQFEPESDEAFDFQFAFAKKLSAKGLVGIAWPKEYGGQGRPHIEQLIFNEEMAYHRAPGPPGQGVSLVGPTVMIYGTEEQKKKHLGGIIRVETVWCQGFSEPGAGSDLASLQLRAVEDGDYFVLNGQKIWTSFAHRSDSCIVLGRTDPDAPKHRGISYFLVNMKTPGITVRPIINMAGSKGFNEVFFDDVRVPKSDLLGEKNRGWYQAATTLDFERSGVGYAAGARRTLEELTAYARETKRNGRYLAEDPLVRSRFAQLATEIGMARVISYRVAWMQSQAKIPNYEASMSKAYGTELLQRVANFGMQLLGLNGQVEVAEPWKTLAGRIERSYIQTVSSTIAAGTSEIQRQIIATRGLGLPR